MLGGNMPGEGSRSEHVNSASIISENEWHRRGRTRISYQVPFESHHP